MDADREPTGLFSPPAKEGARAIINKKDIK